MQLISYRHNAREAYGVVKDGGIVDMTIRIDHPNLKSAISGLSISEIERLAATASPDISIQEIEFMFPITSPEKIFCVGRNYRAYHEVVEDGGSNWPSIFPRFSASFSPNLQKSQKIVRNKSKQMIIMWSIHIGLFRNIFIFSKNYKEIFFCI